MIDRNRNVEVSNRNGIIDNGDRNRNVEISNRNRMMDHRLLHQNVPFTPILSESRREDLSGESATRSSELLMLSEDQDQTPVSGEGEGEGGSKEDHTTSSEMFKPKAKVYHLQPSLLQAPPNAHSTTLTSEDDSLRHNAKLRPQYPLHQSEASARPKYPTVNQSERLIEEPIEPLGSRSEEEVMCKQERAMRRLYEKQTRAPSSRVKSILTNRNQACSPPPTLSSHPSPPSPAPDNWREREVGYGIGGEASRNFRTSRGVGAYAKEKGVLCDKGGGDGLLGNHAQERCELRLRSNKDGNSIGVAGTYVKEKELISGKNQANTEVLGAYPTKGDNFCSVRSNRDRGGSHTYTKREVFNKNSRTGDDKYESNRALGTYVKEKEVFLIKDGRGLAKTGEPIETDRGLVRRGENSENRGRERGEEREEEDWRSPVTESEKMYAMRKKVGVSSPPVHPNPANETLVNYLQLERQNQLDWIKAEIDHLSNLKNLLEKQETLKRHITAYKQTRRVRQTLVRPTGGVSSSGESNQRPAAQETTDQPQKRAKTTGHRKGDGDTAEESNPFEQDKASIYAHKINKDSEYNHPHRSNKEREQQTALYVHNVNRERNRTSVQANKKEKDGDRGLDREGASQPSGQAHKLNKDREWMLPCEFRRRQRNVPTSLKLKHNMNEMMTRDVEKVGLKPTTATTVGATQSTRLKSSTATVESATVKSTLATRSTTPVESTAIQTSDSLLNLPAWLSKPASVEPLTPQENVGSRLASSNQGINKESPPQLCPCIVELYTRVKSGQELLGAGSGSGCKCYSKQNKPGRENIAPPPVGYVITFEPRSKKPKPSTPVDSVPKSPTNPGFSSSESEITTKPRIKTLQEYLEHNRPDYVNRAETRRQCLVEKSYLREQQNSVQHKQKVLLTALKYGAGSESEDKTSGKSKGSHHGRKIFTTRELRSMTRRKYEQLPEVQMKKMDAKRKEAYRTNKLMAEVFTKVRIRRKLTEQTN
uniref:ALMS motif domain-containing protein n=1 Tax=Cacopsylla melanoneura TaxID=428564 RepID=A0A8D8LAD0_9HEMI